MIGFFEGVRVFVELVYVSGNPTRKMAEQCSSVLGEEAIYLIIHGDSTSLTVTVN